MNTTIFVNFAKKSNLLFSMSNLSLPTVQSHILHYLYHRKKPVTIGDIKSKILGSGISYDDLFQSLFQLNYIQVQDNSIELSPEGRQRMDEAAAAETQRIQRLVFDDEFDLALLEFLVHRATLVHLDDVPELLKEQAPKQQGWINDGPLTQALFRMEQKGYVENPFASWYGIKSSGRAFYQHQIQKFNQPSLPAGHGAIIISGNNNQVLSPAATFNVSTPDDLVAHQLAEEQLADIPKAKRNRTAQLIWTVIGIAVAVALFFIDWNCKGS